VKISLSRWFLALSAIAFLHVAGCAAAAPAGEPVPRIAVAFIEPEKFTDASRAELEPTSAGLLGELRQFIIATRVRYLPENTKLNIRVADIDLAGDFELFRGPEADRVRIAKGVYLPRIALEFELLDNAAMVVKTGKRDLTDIDYQSRGVYPQSDDLRYEKDLLREWLRDEFSDLASGKAN